MKFERVPVASAVGAVLAHGAGASGRMRKKGHVLAAADVEEMAKAGITHVMVARLEPGDVAEDAAAARLARAIQGAGITAAAPFTGRCNLYAEAPGVVVFDRARLDAINAVDEAMTLAVAPAFEAVEARQMVATVKIIPFSARDESLRRCEELAQGGGPLLRLAPFGHRHAGFIQTTLPSIKASVLDKTVAVTKARLAARHADMTEEIRCPHEPEALAEALRAMSRHGHDSILVFAASATTDRRDVVPSAIVAAGGEVERLGMPVDPGNLLVLGRIGTVPVIGLPGCARSPKMNGFDWVLDRLCAGLAVTATDIAGMGAGGLLKEIETRPQPRDAEVGRSLPRAPRIAALVLAAGRSSRMGGPNKMLEVIDGKPMVAAVLDGVLASQARPVVMVTGHMADAVGAAIGARPVTIVRNPDFAHGLSTSLRAGLDALPGDIDGVLVCLGDMPMAGPAVLDRLIAAFAPQEGRAICVPTHDGKRGNPVLWAARFIPEMRRLVGDVGARHLIGEHADLVAEVAMESAGVLIDLDTPESLAAYRAGQRAP